MSQIQPPFYSSSEIKSLQEEKLNLLLKYLSLKSPFYKNHFSRHNIDISKINSLDDLKNIPTTSKDDMQNHNWDFLCVDKNEIAEFMTTSGTMGHPVTVALNENDLERLAYNEYCSFLCADSGSNDIYQLMISLDRQFMAGLAYYSGLRMLGAGVIRLGAVSPQMQWQSIQRNSPTALIAVPSLLVKLVEYANENSIDLNSCSVKKAICIGENIRTKDLKLNALGEKINQKWNIQLFSTYASTEMQTGFTECRYGKGGHLLPELIIAEILDENGNHVKSGEEGEVTITTLGVEAMPLLRYRTGDICRYYDEPCECGRNTIRLSPVAGRKQQLIKFKGTTFYPPALFDILNEIKEVSDYYIEVFTSEIYTDEIVLNIVHSGNQSACDQKVKSHLQSTIRVIPQIKYITAEEMNAFQLKSANRKTMRFVDRRYSN